MDRRAFIGRVAGSLAAVPLAAGARQTARLPRIGVLYSEGAGTRAANLSPEVLREGLQEPGYVEGRTVVIEWRSCEGTSERLREAVAVIQR